MEASLISPTFRRQVRRPTVVKPPEPEVYVQVPFLVWDSYWGTYSRSLGKIGDYDKVEVDLTPVNGWTNIDGEEGLNVAKVRSINIRRHCTAMDRGDRYLNLLPQQVHHAMIEHLGLDLTRRLLTEDFLPQIDWDKYRLHATAALPSSWSGATRISSGHSRRSRSSWPTP
jgi:hypothetical protein